MKIRRASSRHPDADTAVADLRAALDGPDLRALFFFCSPAYDLARLGPALARAFACPIMGCTTAGQIGPHGFQAGGVVAASVADVELTMRPFPITDLAHVDQRAAEIAAEIERTPLALGHRRCALLLVDGVSRAEERLAAALYAAIGDVQIIGGSAGDDLRFERTHVYADGRLCAGTAVLALIDTTEPFQSFRFHHFTPTARRVVVTEVVASERLVTEIDGLPAAEGYASALGVTVADLDATMMARHPLLLRVGREEYVRSIARVEPGDALRFYCAIDRGAVLSIGEARDPIDTVERAFGQLGVEPALVIGCDCILRRLELEERGLDRTVGDRFARAGVIGFSTYGEQWNATHVNQTFTGIALGMKR